MSNMSLKGESMKYEVRFLHRAAYELLDEAEEQLGVKLRGFVGQFYKIYMEIEEADEWILIGSVVILKTGPGEMDFKWFHLYLRSFVNEAVKCEVAKALGGIHTYGSAAV